MASNEHPAAEGPISAYGIRGAQVTMSCDTLEPTLSFFLEKLGFRLEAIFPADNPRAAILSGHGLQLRLAKDAVGGVGSIELLCADPPPAQAGGSHALTAPNGVVVKFIAADPPMKLPATRQALVVSRTGTDDHWEVGRAGLRYRDLVPERHGGAFIASHIRVLEGGPVPDYVHFHKVRFQTIFCRKGWVELLYEGQGEAFILNAGDCVLQPPTIRHRVVSSSAGAEVIEISTPAEHITMPDHALALPTPDLYKEREFGGQRFVRHIASQASWNPWRVAGFQVRDTGIAEATKGLAGVRVVRPAGQPSDAVQSHDTEFCFYFVLAGKLEVEAAGLMHRLGEDDSITIPGHMAYRFSRCSEDLELLEVTLPAGFALLNG